MNTNNTNASAQKRFFAFLIDVIFFFLSMLIIEFLDSELSGIFNSIFAIISLGLIFGYFPVTEGLFGKTVGKKIVGIKVIRDNGNPMSIGTGYIRLFFGYLDWLTLGIVALILIPKTGKRIADWGADTLVVNDK